MRFLKRLFTVLLALLLAASCAGCSTRAAAAASPTPEPTPSAAPEPTPEPTPQPTPDPVALAGRLFEADATELDLTGCVGTAEELRAALPKFNKLTFVDVTGWPLSNLEEYELAAAWPDIEFGWDVDIEGTAVNSLETLVSLDDVPLSGVAAVESVLPLLYRAEQIDMCRCGIDDESMYAFRERTRNVKIVWQTRLGVCDLRTDATYFCSNLFGKRTKIRDELLAYQAKYFPDMLYLDLGHCGTNVTTTDWLSGMPKLVILILTECDISDLTAIGGLKDLAYLEIYLMPSVDDLSPLAGLQNLHDLIINRASTSDLTPLYDCARLQRLWCLFCPNLTEEEVDAFQAARPDVLVSSNYHPYPKDWRDSNNYYWMRDCFHGYYMYP